MSKALEGVRILDLSHVQAGPTGTQLLAWMGADVIKVEMPGRGDITRGQLQDVKGADSLYFTMLNSNKRSITINLKSPGGKAILEELVRRCDVVVENFGPGVLDRQGFTWARFQELLAHGPLLEYPTKEFGDTVPRAGNASGGGQPGAALRCAPGGPNDYIYVIIQPPCWAPLMKITGREELIHDPDFATPEARLPRIPECSSIIEKWTITKTKFEVLDALNEFDIPCGPILSMKDIYEDKELYERGYLVELDHPTRGRYVQLGMPIKLSDSPAEVKRSPLLGEHTEEVLGWLGYGDAA